MRLQHPHANSDSVFPDLPYLCVWNDIAKKRKQNRAFGLFHQMNLPVVPAVGIEVHTDTDEISC